MLKASNLVNAVVICKSNHPLVWINNVNYSMFFEIVGGLGRLRYRFVLSDVLLRKAQVWGGWVHKVRFNRRADSRLACRVVWIKSSLDISWIRVDYVRSNWSLYFTPVCSNYSPTLLFMTTFGKNLEPSTFRYWWRCSHRKRWLHTSLTVNNSSMDLIRISKLAYYTTVSEPLPLWQHPLLVINQVSNSLMILRIITFLNTLLGWDPIDILSNHHLYFLITSVIEPALHKRCWCQSFSLWTSNNILVTKKTTCKDLICT